MKLEGTATFRLILSVTEGCQQHTFFQAAFADYSTRFCEDLNKTKMCVDFKNSGTCKQGKESWIVLVF